MEDEQVKDAREAAKSAAWSKWLDEQPMRENWDDPGPDLPDAFEGGFNAGLEFARRPPEGDSITFTITGDLRDDQRAALEHVLKGIFASLNGVPGITVTAAGLHDG